MAEFERRLIAERTRDGIAAARGRAASGRLLVEPSMSLAQAAVRLGIGQTTVYRYLQEHPITWPDAGRKG